MTLALLWLQLAGSAAFILVASNFLAKSADIIALKTGLGRAFVGVLLLATATSLPELGTGVSSVTFVDEPDLAAGDAFGSNLFNLLIIGLLDIFWRNGPILTTVSRTSVVVAILSMTLISLAGAAVIVHYSTEAVSSWYISPFSVALFVVFLGAMYMIYRFQKVQGTKDEAPSEAPSETPDYADESLRRASLTYLAAAAVIVTAAVWLAQTGDRIADHMGWEASFVGTQFLAFSTSLPELAASFAAIRLRATELAITNLLGSNLFNMGFVLFLDDVAYSKGPLWADVSLIHALTAVAAILMTTVVVTGLVGKRRKRPGKYWTVEAVSLIALYLLASVLVFAFG